MILDCDFGPIGDAAKLARQLEGRAGIVEHGLFLGLTHLVVVSSPSGIREMTSDHHEDVVNCNGFLQSCSPRESRRLGRSP
jgi:hypothetical protein